MNIDEKYEKLINFFKEISKVPRNSKQEEKIADFLCDFARKRDLWYRKDEFNNVLIKRKASEGYENKNVIMFQAHTDMVCEKTKDSIHDFTKDPIEIIEDGDILRAKDTTLGGDDGIGVAYLMLLLDDKDIKLPAIECLFTTEEEIGMNGARAFDYSDINASYLINLDGEEENTAIVGCAGGVSITYSKKVELNKCKDKVYKIEVSGLYGGHSGVDIDKGRINSNYLLAKLLSKITDVRIISFNGGSKDNAIANSSEVIFASNMDNIEKIINDVVSKIHFVDEDKNVNVDVLLLDKLEYNYIGNDESRRFLSLICGLKQNVIEYSKDIDGLVETSGNIGIVSVEGGKISIVESLRSSIDSKKDEVREYNNKLAIDNGYNVQEEGEYPGWKYNPDSELEKLYVQAYKKYHNNEAPIVCAIHAGVECGMIYEKLPHLDMISLGPDVKDVHTVNEKLYLSSCKTLLKTLLEIIHNLH